jgi:flagellar motor protein MotB
MWTLLLGCPKSALPDPVLVDQLDREIRAGNERIKMLERELEGCGETIVPNSLYPELVQVFQGSDVQISREGIATRLVVRTSSLFGDPYALKSRAEGDLILDLLSVGLKNYSDHQVLVIGHTSDRPLPQKWATTYTSLMDWSSALAGELVRRLVEEFECNPSQFTIGGRGAYSPRESNDLETGRDANQRLEIWIYPPSSAPPAP